MSVRQGEKKDKISLDLKQISIFPILLFSSLQFILIKARSSAFRGQMMLLA
jgi:hypothetical protein